MLKSMALGLALMIGCGVTSGFGVEVVASVKPIHSLVAGVMAGTGSEPTLIVKGASSAHGFSLKPSDAENLAKADIVFWVGGTYELFLVSTLPSVAPEITSVPLIETPGIETLPFREGGLFQSSLEAEERDEADAGHAEEGADPHIWLDPQMAMVMVRRIAEELTAIDPANSAAYQENSDRLIERIAALQADISERLEGATGSFFVFHDAYNYFEKRFGIQATGTFTINPAVAPGARRIAEIQQIIVETGGVCLFSEPQFSPALIEALVRDTGATAGVLDPMGAGIEDGPDLYFELMAAIANSLALCLRF